jgi:hypothetical protein
MSSNVSSNANSKSYAYTLNNYSEEELLALKNLECQYHVIGFEVGDNGTPHLQGTVTWEGNKRFRAAKNLIGERAHIEATRNVFASRQYCKKTGNFWESGPEPSQGKRSDLALAVESLMEMRDLGAVAGTYPQTYVRFHQGLAALMRDTEPPRTSRPKVNRDRERLIK